MHRLPLGLRPRSSTPKTRWPPQPGAGKDVRTGLHHRRAVRGRDQAGAARARRHRAADGSTPKAPYFTAWLRQQLVERYGAAKAFFGGLKVKSTLDLQLQEAAEEAVNSYLGDLAADRLGGRDRQPQRRHQGDGRRPRLRRQRRSTWRPRATASPAPRSSRSSCSTALEAGHLAGNGLRIGAAGLHASARRARKSSRSTTTRTATSAPARSSYATTYSDNSVYAQLGLEGIEGQHDRRPHPRDRRDDPQDGLRRPISTNPAMVLGGLEGRRHAARRGPTPSPRSATTATGSAAPSRRAPATARSPTPRSPTRTAT